jgi:hypothetical protein
VSSSGQSPSLVADSGGPHHGMYIWLGIRHILTGIYCVGVMISIKCTQNWSNIFSKLKFTVTFLKYVEIAVVSIQLTQ